MVKRSVTELHRTDEKCSHEFSYDAAQPGRHARSKFQLRMGGGRGSNSDNATSPDEAINHGRHSENISVVDDTRETSILMAYGTHKDEKRKFADDLD